MKYLNRILIPFFLLLMFGLTSCDQKTNAEKAVDSVEMPNDADRKAFTEKREKLQKQVQESRDEIAEEVKELREELADATEDERENINDKIEKLEEYLEEINADMKNLGDNISDNWEEFKRDNSWDKFSNNVEKRIKNIEAEIDREF